MTDDDRLDPKVLAAYEVPEASPDLGDRFVAALAASRRRRLWPFALAGAAAVAAVIAVIVVVVTDRHETMTAGTAAPTTRTTVALAARGVAVAEAGSRLSWEIGSDAHVDQPIGNVFYRVEPGGAFVVTTPVGDVSVHGTCFRVEVESTTTGASVAVTVYEGTVAVANHHGSVEVTAGETAAATLASAPRLAPTNVTQATPPDLTVADLVAREHAQRARIVDLEAKLARREPHRPRTKAFEMSAAELTELAATCSVPFDIPPIFGSTVLEQRIDDGLREAHLDEHDRAAVQRVAARRQTAYTAGLQALFRELTNDDTTLDPLSLLLEIPQKSTPEDVSVAHRNVAEEHAGLRKPPGDLATGTIMERYLRQGIAAADGFEQELAAEIGADRAREFRRTWGVVDFEPGCPTP